MTYDTGFPSFSIYTTNGPNFSDGTYNDKTTFDFYFKVGDDITDDTTRVAAIDC